MFSPVKCSKTRRSTQYDILVFGHISHFVSSFISFALTTHFVKGPFAFGVDSSVDGKFL